MYSGGVTGGTTNSGVYTIAALTHTVGNTGSVTVTSNTINASIGTGGVNGSISSAAVGASATTSFSVITR